MVRHGDDIRSHLHDAFWIDPSFRVVGTEGDRIR